MNAARIQDLDAIILTGGRSRRMGQDKASQLWGGRRAVDLLGDLARDLGARRILTCGEGDFGLEQIRDPRPHGGPVSGVLAGLTALGPGNTRVIVLAVDAPTLTATDLAPLLAAASPGAAFVGLPIPMIAERAAFPAEAVGDWPLRRLVERAGLAQIEPDPTAALRLRGANTLEERERLLREAGLD